MERQFRFKTGDRVKIWWDDSGPFVGLDGIVDAIEPNSSELALLDRYLVVFQWGEKQPFYDAQLVKAGAEER